jgi:hypothetical protein
MSGTTSGPLSSAEIVAVRRYCGYPPPSAAVQPDPITVALAPLTQDYIDVIRNSFLANLYLLESDIPATRAKLSIDEAAVFKRNSSEVKEREGIYRATRLALCGAIGIFSGPFLDIYLPGAFVV